MAIRKTNDIANDPNINSRLKGSVQVAEILERYNVTKTDNILPGDEAFGYLSEKIDQCIDTINTNTSKTGITSDQASAITANTNKVGFVTTMPTATDGHTVSLSVTNSRGTYALVFTMVDSTGRTPVTKTATIGLE